MSSVPETLTRLPLPAIPEVLERAIGYHGDARYLLLYWEPAGDEVMWNDGQRSTCGEWHSYLRFIQHPKIAWALAAYEFGGSDAPARDGLVLDREARVVYAGPIEVARQWVREQHGPRLTLEAWAAQEGITVAEARLRQQQAMEEWRAAFREQWAALRADARHWQAEVAERMRVTDANDRLLQAALDALPEPALSAPMKAGITLHRIVCALCQVALGDALNLVATIPATVGQHLADAHRLTVTPGKAAEWQRDVEGILCYQPGDHPLIRLEPPHLWISGAAIGRDEEDTRHLNQMAMICRQQFPDVFDALALRIWCGSAPDALLRYVQHVTGPTSSLSLEMVQATLAYLTWQQQHAGRAKEA